ncbi:hypothetical protein ACOMHN_039947 [Nucella lapillus]
MTISPSLSAHTMRSIMSFVNFTPTASQFLDKVCVFLGGSIHMLWDTTDPDAIASARAATSADRCSLLDPNGTPQRPGHPVSANGLPQSLTVMLQYAAMKQ